MFPLPDKYHHLRAFVLFAVFLLITGFGIGIFFKWYLAEQRARLVGDVLQEVEDAERRTGQGGKYE